MGYGTNSGALRCRTIMRISQKAKERMAKAQQAKKLEKLEANKKAKEDVIELDGTVVHHARNLFKVQLENGAECQCTISGRLRMNKIKVMEGDTVTVELSPFDLTRGRITFRKIDKNKLGDPPADNK